ncbi:hypothetical protein FOA52_013401 [Chlamydomonas sp. UWO 241]|nr:hypothetical protein FOA52_013401 [Chlamydomonas sp. UWO 241]
MASTSAAAVTVSLKELLWKVFELEEAVKQGVAGPEQQALLEQRLHALMSQIKETAGNTSVFEDYTVPINLLHHLDDGGTPDQYTAEAFRVALGDNQAAKGKVSALSSLRTQLLSELSNVAPEESAQYTGMEKTGGGGKA